MTYIIKLIQCHSQFILKHCLSFENELLLYPTFACFSFSYIATVPENVVEGTALVFEGGMDKVQDLDKVSKARI